MPPSNFEIPNFDLVFINWQQDGQNFTNQVPISAGITSKILKVSSVARASILKILQVSLASISKVAGVANT